MYIAIIFISLLILGFLSSYYKPKVSRQVISNLSKLGYKESMGNTHKVMVDPAEGYRLIDTIYFDKDNKSYYVTVIEKGKMFKPKEVIISEPIAL